MPPSSFWCTVCKSLFSSHSKHSSALDVKCFLSSILTFQPLKMLWTNSDCNCPRGRMSATACCVAEIVAHGRLPAPRFGGPKSKSRDRLKFSESSQRIECTTWRCGDIVGILVGWGSFVPRISFTLCVYCLRHPLCWSCRCRPGPQCW